MSDDYKIISTRSHPKFANKICSHLDKELTPSKVHEFSNDNMMFQIQESVRKKDVFIISTQAESVHKNIWETILAVDATKRASADRVTVVTPYFPYARSDKEDQPRISVGARCMNTILESCGADRVLTTDLHADHIQAFFKPEVQCDQLKAAKFLCNHLKEEHDLDDYILVAPDAGAVKMLRKYQNDLGLNIAMIDKRRRGNTDNTEALAIVGEVEGKKCLIIDDEVSSGSTLIEAADLLKNKGAEKIIAACIHPVLGANAVENIQQSKLNKLIVTDTIPTEGKEFAKLEQISISQLFANSIKRIHKGKSISKLF